MAQSKEQLPLVLFVYANDKVSYLSNIPEETNNIKEVFDRAISEYDIEVQLLPFSDADSLLNLIHRNSERLLALHFSGHTDDQLWYLDEGQINAEGLVAVLKKCHQLQFIFLNGCDNQAQINAFASIGIPSLIGTTEPINDKQAGRFSDFFYQALLVQNLSIQAAFDQATQSIDATIHPDDKHLRSLKLPTADQSDIVPWFIYPINDAEQHQWKLSWVANACKQLPQLAQRELPTSPYKNLYYFKQQDAEIFFGRCQAILDIYDYLDAVEPVILLHGQTGVGKSSFLQAGLIPRLESSKQSVTYQTYYHRFSSSDENALPILNKIFDSTDPLSTWLAQEKDNEGKPLILIFDQMEELCFNENEVDDNTNLPLALINFVDSVKKLFYSSSQNRPKGKLILSLRKEWFSEFHEACSAKEVAQLDYLLKPLGKRNIIEIIEGIPQQPRLQKKYQLQLENPEDGTLAGIIADDLVTDNKSSIAPILQIILSKMWDRVENQRTRVFSLSLYEELRKQGLLLTDFLDQQIRAIGKLTANAEKAKKSGLLLDILYAHTNSKSLASTLENDSYDTQYGHISYREEIKNSLIAHYLLIEPDTGIRQGKSKSTRLAHDTLAAHIREQYDASDLPGQRARRIMNTRKTEWIASDEQEVRPVLDDHDLTIVEQGKEGTQYWDGIEKSLLTTSRQAQAKKVAKSRRLKVAALLGLLLLITTVVVSIGFYFNAQEQTNVAEFRNKQIAINNMYTASLSLPPEKSALAILLARQGLEFEKPLGGNWVQNYTHLASIINGRELPFFTTFYGAAKSPDGDTLGTYTKDGYLTFWDLKKPGKRFEIQSNKKDIDFVEFTRDSKYFLTKNTKEGTSLAWNPKTGEIAKDYVPKLKSSSYLGCDISPYDSVKVIIDEEKNTLSFVDLDTNKIISGSAHKAPEGHQLKAVTHENQCTGRTNVFSPTRELLVSVDKDNKSLVVWNVKTGFPLTQRVIRLPSEHKAHSINFTHNGKVLVTYDITTDTLAFWDIATEKLKAPISKFPDGHEPYINAFGFSPDGRFMFSQNTDVKDILFWDIATGNATTKRPIRLANHEPNGFRTFSNDGRFLATMDKTRRNLVFWNLSTSRPVFAKPIPLPKEHGSLIQGWFTSNDEIFVTQDFNNRNLIFWDPKTGSMINSNILYRNRRHTSDLKYKHKRKLIKYIQGEQHNALITYDEISKELVFWTLESGHAPVPRIIKLPQTHLITRMAQSPDNKLLVTSDFKNKTLRFWDIVNARPIPHLELVQKAAADFFGYIAQSQFSRDSKILVMNDKKNGKVVIWNIANFTHIKPTTIQLSEGFKFDGSLLSPNGKILLVIEDQKKFIQIVDLKTQKIIHQLTLSEKDQSGLSLVFSPDSHYLVQSNWNTNSIDFWNLQTGKLASSSEANSLPFQHTINSATSLKFSKNGKLVESHDKDNKTTVYWDIRTGKIIPKPVENIDLLLSEYERKYTKYYAVPTTNLLVEVDSISGLHMKNALTQAPLPNFKLGGAQGFLTRDVSMVWFVKDKTLSLWDLKSQTSIIKRLTFSPETSVPLESKGLPGESIAFVTKSLDEGYGYIDLEHFFDDLESKACRYAGRNLTHEEWKEYIGSTFPYQKTCPEYH